MDFDTGKSEKMFKKANDWGYNAAQEIGSWSGRSVATKLLKKIMEILQFY